MLDNRFIISKRLAKRNNSNWNGQFDNSTDFPEGYSKQNHEVLLYSFLAAYRGQDPSKMKLPDVQQPGSTQGFFSSNTNP